MKNYKDGYAEFLNYFKISDDDFLEFAKKSIILIPKQKAREEWDSLREGLQSTQGKVFVRSYGRNGSGNSLYRNFYNLHFKAQIEIDKTNNARPTQMIQKLTDLYKSGKNLNIQNYQVSHIFGKTKNPYAFCAPWNVVFLPKILDPFTGHESKGELTSRITKMYQEIMCQEYGDLISEYNEYMKLLQEKIQAFIQSTPRTDKKTQDFHSSLLCDFSAIHLAGSQPNS